MRIESKVDAVCQRCKFLGIERKAEVAIIASAEGRENAVQWACIDCWILMEPHLDQDEHMFDTAYSVEILI